MLRKPESGRPRVAVRPYYEGLPPCGLDAGRMKAGESLPDKGVNALVRPRKHGPLAQNRRGGAPKGVRASQKRALLCASAAEVETRRLSALCPFGGFAAWEPSRDIAGRRVPRDDEPPNRHKIRPKWPAFLDSPGPGRHKHR